MLARTFCTDAILHAITTSTGLNLLMLKNPHGGGIEWNGEYSDGHSSWSPALQKEVDRLTQTKLGTQPADDGSFWMSARDFAKWFSDIGCCNAWPEGSTLCAAEMELAARVSSGGPPGFGLFQYNPAVEIRSALPQTVHISLSQRDIRGKSDVWPLLFLYSQEQGEPPAKLMTLDHRTCGVDVKLRPRKPLKLVVSAWKPGYCGLVWFSVTSQKRLDLQRVSAVSPEPQDADNMALINESPTCYMTKRAVDFSSSHYITDHGFVFKEAFQSYEQARAPTCSNCGNPCVGDIIRSKRTGNEFCSMECAQGSSSKK